MYEYIAIAEVTKKDGVQFLKGGRHFSPDPFKAARFSAENADRNLEHAQTQLGKPNLRLVAITVDVANYNPSSEEDDSTAGSSTGDDAVPEGDASESTE